MSQIEVGQIVEGVVTGITNFGAFVLLPNGETGLVHISEVADSYVKDINEHLQKKDKVKVKVLNVNGDGKIGLSIRRVSNDGKKDTQQQQRKGARPRSGGGRPQGRVKVSFEDRLSNFMKESDERQQDLKRHTESKRGGRNE